MARGAGEVGLESIGCTDHSKGLKIARGLDESRLGAQGQEIRLVNESLRSEGLRLEVLRSAEVNLSAFETFFDERRPFFIERSNLFHFSEGTPETFFYSRRIGRQPSLSALGTAPYVDEPQAATILGDVIERHLVTLNATSSADLLEARYQKFRQMGDVGLEAASPA